MPSSPTPDLIELRRYRLHPGQREALVALFEREFIETQEACGLQVLGQFRDLDDADRFTWLRGFADMGARRAGLLPARMPHPPQGAGDEAGGLLAAPLFHLEAPAAAGSGSWGDAPAGPDAALRAAGVTPGAAPPQLARSTRRISCP